MGVENQVTAVAKISCGCCGDDNRADTKFCKGCGQSLYESCVGCGHSVMLTQRFCGSCGADLAKAVESVHEQHEQLLRNAVVAAKEYDFDHSIQLLQRVASLRDYRFKEASNNAKQAITKIEAMRDRANTSMQQSLTRAKAEYDQGNQVEVVQILESVPARLLSDDAKKLLSRVKTYTAGVSDLEASVKSGIANQNWTLVGSLVDQLLEHHPGNETYTRVAEQVTGKLISESRQLFTQGKYAAAVERLSSVPSIGRTRELAELRQTYDNLEWLSRQFDGEPFVSPMLGRLSVRFAKEVPDNTNAKEQVRKMAAQLKQAKRQPRNPLPAWKAAGKSWLGGETNLLGTPLSVEIADQQLLKTCPARFHVAIGLALQGLGHARIGDHFAPRKGILSSLGWRKKKLCWGVDIGTAALKAVCLVEGEDGLEIVDSYFDEFADPVCRGADEVDRSGVIEAAISKLLDQKEIADAPVWANLAASDLIHRFVRLPPVAEKQANSVLDAEIGRRVPIAMEDLAVVRWLGRLEEDSMHGRPAVVTAAKQSVVEKRVELLTAAGLKIAGLQGDTVALANFAAYEFADVFAPDALLPVGEQETPRDSVEDVSESNSVEQASESNHVDDDDHQAARDDKTPAIAIIECGASTTSLVLVSAETHWLWTIESGGEDLTAALARSTKSTLAEAEKLKRNPAAITFPARQYVSVEQRLEANRVRLERIFADALTQNRRFDVVQSWCLGGGCLAHQWIRRLMLSKS